MADANLLNQLENSLISYQETQETLDAVVRAAQATFGDNWISELPHAFDNAQIEDATKSLLKDKIDHAVHYYGALTAWQEASAYLSDPSSVTLEALSERIPVLEYWLALFGNEGTELTNQVKALYRQIAQNNNQTPETEQTNVTPATNEPATETVASDEKVTTIAEEQALNTVQAQETPAQPIAAETVSKTSEPVQMIEPVMRPNTDRVQHAQEAPAEQKEPLVEPSALLDADAGAIEQAVAETAQMLQASEEQGQDQPIETQPLEQTQPIEQTQPVEVQSIEQTQQPLEAQPVFNDPNAIPSIDAVVTEQNAVSAEPQIAQPSTDNLVEETANSWTDTNTSGEAPLENWIDLENIPMPQTQDVQIEQEPIIDAKEVMEGYSRPVSQNWDIANFLRQKRLYDDANNWLSAWCIRMDNAEKTSYPHYGFIVDIMHDLKEKIQNVLENQLLEEVVDREIPGGRIGMERLAKAIDQEIEDLPDDFKLSTEEKIKLNAREILGRMDTSEEQEDIGPAPDGFELMDDPYAASADKIISDFEKTEQEAQNQIDKLNVIEDNKDIEQKKD